MADPFVVLLPPPPRGEGPEGQGDLLIGPDGEQLAHPWPAPPAPRKIAPTFRCFDWGPGEVGPWRANTEAERAARQGAWNSRPR